MTFLQSGSLAATRVPKGQDLNGGAIRSDSIIEIVTRAPESYAAHSGKLGIASYRNSLGLLQDVFIGLFKLVPQRSWGCWPVLAPPIRSERDMLLGARGHNQPTLDLPAPSRS